jgi:hypothetical protein
MAQSAKISKAKAKTGKPADKPADKTAHQTDNGNLVINIRITKKIYDRLNIYTESKGHINIQETIRLAVSLFLDKQGY